MGPFTASEPKVMIPVGNRPILEHVVRALAEQDVRDIVIVVGYRRERIMSYFEDGKPFDARIEYAVEGKQLGTGHSLSEAPPPDARGGPPRARGAPPPPPPPLPGPGGPRAGSGGSGPVQAEELPLDLRA